MNVLIFDYNYEENYEDYIRPLTDNIKDLKAKIYECFELALKEYQEKEYDFLIIDFTSTHGKKLLDFVLQNNPKQKVITLGFQLESSDANCALCEENFNKRRLIKPVNAVDIYNTIKNFDTSRCKYAYQFENPKELISELVKRYGCFEFNEQTSMITKNTDANDHVIKDYIELIEILKHYNMNHEIIDEFVIRID